MDFKKRVKKLLIKNELEKALEILGNYSRLTKKAQKSVVLLRKDFSALKNDYANRTITNDEHRALSNQLSERLLEFLDNPSNFKRSKSKFSLWGKSNEYDAEKAREALEEELPNIRNYLLERYLQRLEQKTAHRLTVELILTYTKEGTSPNYLHLDPDIREGEKITGHLYETMLQRKHILLLGAPGAGKTTELLQLAVKALKEKELAVIFNLAQWSDRNMKISDWMQAVLVEGYGFSKDLARVAIEEKRIIPLFDGLDEVGRRYQEKEQQIRLRTQCLKAIDSYIASQSGVFYLIICSKYLFIKFIIKDTKRDFCKFS